jgi:hypothetical protein
VLELGAPALSSGAGDGQRSMEQGRWRPGRGSWAAVDECGLLALGRPKMNNMDFHLIQNFQINSNLQHFQTYLPVLEKIQIKYEIIAN